MKLFVTAVLSSLSLTVAAQGYVLSSDSQPVRDSSGQCVRTGSWTPSDRNPACDPATPKRSKVFLSADIMFGFDKFELTEQGRAELDKLAFSTAVGSRVTVTGHTDWIGTDEYNLALSERRAVSVANYLSTKVKATFTVMGMGPTDPIPVTELCRKERNFKKLVACLAPNRRVEVDFLPK